MCGIAGVIGRVGREMSARRADVARMCAAMAVRGPDGEGLHARENAILGHRRLAVIDPAHGHQPMVTEDGRFAITYNGELYNDEELRAALAKEGAEFKSRSDAETALAAVAHWGTGALGRMRGMFALGVYDYAEQRLILARDPLGMKPLHFAVAGQEFVFASTARALCEFSGIGVEPDPRTVSAYLTTLCTTLGRQTMFAGVMTLRPGEALVWNAREGGAPRIETYWREPRTQCESIGFEEACGEVRRIVSDAVAAHLRSDAPMGMFLSGGLDSAIIATVCKEMGATDALRTWCAVDEQDSSGDGAHAERVARALGATHRCITVHKEDFAAWWMRLVEEGGLPLSTPNQIAIHMVAREMREAGVKVALTGEGADELFAGYGPPMLAGLDWAGAQSGGGGAAIKAKYGTEHLGDETDHYLRVNSWIAVPAKSAVFQPEFMKRIEDDHALRCEIESAFGGCGAGEPLERLLRVHRRINLTRLLERLDQCTMLASVEGRTPFADVRIMESAMRLPMEWKFAVQECDEAGEAGSTATCTKTVIHTKRVLRAAFADLVPQEVLDRPKASFALPFREWMVEGLERASESEFLKSMVRLSVLDAIRSNPSQNWLAAWPVANLGLWCARWFG